ncbi:MAG: hypothetical protein QOK35_3592 [Pseudonocardiales bacterium]|nr:hypothetical protein [Pseudonocardiales bacterium]
MRRLRFPAAAAVLCCAAVAAGCGLGPGSDTGSAEMSITRDYGSAELAGSFDFDATESDTVLRVLDSHEDITTRYGGRFVQSIDGVSGDETGGRRYDWFFYVNGVESPQGSADVKVHGGDRIWWDFRDWTAAMRVPAVVGSYPEPFKHGFEGHDYSTRIECAGTTPPCEAARRSLESNGVKADVSGSDPGGGPALRVIVGTWDAVGKDHAAALIDQGPAVSGVFARFEDGKLVLLDAQGRPSERFGVGAGLVAAVRDGDGPPTWVLTGTDKAGVAAAVALFNRDDLEDHCAVAATPSVAPEALPLIPGS